MSNLRLSKIKSQTPISIIIHGGNRIGYLTAKTLVEQGCYVAIVDKFNNETKKYLTELKKSELFDFFDFRGFNSLFKNLKRFDYLFYFLNEKLVKEDNFDSKEFLTESKILEDSLINAKKHNAKFSLVTSLALNRKLANIVNNTKLSSPSPYSNIELQKYCETLTAEFKDKSNLNLRILRLGTVIGKGIDKVGSPVIHDLFSDATQKAQITIKGEGLDIHSLIHENDATYGILKLTFTDSTKEEVISLANSNDYTTLSLAYKLLELNTEAQAIRFVENPEEQFLIQDLYVPAIHAKKFGWVQQVSLEEALIEQIQNYYDSSNKTWSYNEDPSKKRSSTSSVTLGKTKLGEFLSSLFSPIKQVKERREKREVNIKKLLTTIAISVATLFFTYFVLYPIIGTSIGFIIINSATKNLSTSVLDLNEESVKKDIQKIERNIGRISESVDNLYWLFQITGKGDLYDNTTRLILASKYTVQGASELATAVTPLSAYIRDFESALDFQTSSPTTTREYREYLKEIEQNSFKLDEATYRISLASEIVNNLNTTVFPKGVQDKIIEIKHLISKLEEGTLAFSETVNFLPDILGVNERKRYLLFFQNESELRSSGGWLSSYGVVGIEGGQIRELFVDDIYNADGTLKIQNKRYTPPKSMANALEITDWSLSLVNWYPDLFDTMVEAEPFIEDLGKGSRIDGLITVNITFIQKLLNRWEGIEVPGETELVTSENLYDKIFEMHSEFTPGSAQKATFLANLANEIVKKFLSMSISELLSTGDILEESFDEKHLQATFKNTQAFNFFNSRNWANSLDSRYNNAPIAIDWNWGANKANLYLDKNYTLNITIKDEDTIDFFYSIVVENSSRSEIYPEGNYKNYQRIYIPPEATVLRVSGMEGNDYSAYKESGFKVIAGWFNTPILSTNTLEIGYRIQRDADSANFPIKIQEQNAFLNLSLFKQPGEKRHAYRIDLTYPSTWSLESSGDLNSISNQLSGRFELNKDLTFPIIWKIPN